MKVTVMVDRLTADQQLLVGQELVSPNGMHRLDMQGDGNLVIYRASGLPKWATGTDGRQTGGVVMQGDGNLVIYDRNGVPIWASGTDGHPGAVLVMQDDGNLVIYDVNGRALWATGTNITMMRVTGFLPSVNGFHFQNSFNHGADLQVNIGVANLSLGDAANGLCGGMVFAVRDIFETGGRPPALRAAPSSGPLFDFIARRLFDSFDLPVGVLRYLALMNPNLPDHETVASRMGFAPHGRGWISLMQEWPIIRASLDAGFTTPIALVLEISADPGRMGHNHQVLAWGYDLDGADLTIRVYDPNYPDNDQMCIVTSLAHPDATTAMTLGQMVAQADGTMALRADDTVHAFFAQPYRLAMPPMSLTTPLPERLLFFSNASPMAQVVRIFAPGDRIMLVALTAGEFEIGPGAIARWSFPADLASVRVSANGRPFAQTFVPGDSITLTQDDTVLIRNLTAAPVPLRMFRVDDGLMWATLPGGNVTVPPMDSLRYAVPGNIQRIKVVGGGRTTPASRGDTVVFGP